MDSHCATTTVMSGHLQLGLRLTPQGNLVLEEDADAPSFDETVAARLIQAFSHGAGYGLMRLGAGEVGRTLPPVFGWWRDFAARYVGGLCLRASDAFVEVPPPVDSDLISLVLAAPLMPGGEYLN
ncbi:MAG: hypothetical protein H7839_22220, partial [Magnetococcus sp. YQC-5]